MGLSVVIPVYNGEKYIEECLRSIMNQTYKDLQIIVVNDGSEDKTESIVKSILLEDSRIQLMSQINRGVSSARNRGLKYAENEFITFVDCDDTLDLNMYEILMNYANTNEFDIIHCGYKRINDKEIKEVSGTGKIEVQNSYEALECIIKGKKFVGSLWNKIYKKSLFNGIRFDESLKVNEDILINYQVFKKSRKSIFIDEAKYNYFERNTSACNMTNRTKKAQDGLKVAKIILCDCKNSNLKESALTKYFQCLVSLYRNYYYSKNKAYRNVRNEIKQFYENNSIEVRKDKISAILIIYVPHLYGISYKIYDKIRIPNWDV